ncbi:MAG: dipeptide/oligopeptide/nickel transporter ATP-binding protein [Thermoleophilia bacterium]|nr:dipeptide/oligopeptide/nickel transporter ATP-binding protein [Thermoleophilia bacterium]
MTVDYNAAPILQVRNLKKHFPIKKGAIFAKQVGAVKAVDDISFDLWPGETLGMVGESGCGKSTTGRAILQLHKPTSGSVVFQGQELTGLSNTQMRPVRRDMQIVFQDPYASLNPRMTVGNIIAEPLVIHSIGDGGSRKARVKELLDIVGLNPAFTNRYPHEFSGGQRQRIGIARALALQPKLIICDEPVSALDVSIQAQVMNLLEDLQTEFDLTYLFIAHDLAVVKHVSDRVAVMYLGKIVELAEADKLYEDPQHPYTQALLSSIPVADPRVARRKDRIVLSGDVPSPANPPPGCPFHVRCWKAQSICKQQMPPLEMKDGDPGHQMACWFPGPEGAPGTITPAKIIEQMRAEEAAGLAPPKRVVRSSDASRGTGGVDPATGLPPHPGHDAGAQPPA